MNARITFKSLVILGALGLILSFAGTSIAAQKMLIGSTSASSSHYGYFVAVSQVINEKVAGLETSVVETGATVIVSASTVPVIAPFATMCACW